MLAYVLRFRGLAGVVLLDEVEAAAPGVGRGIGVLLVGAVEEAMGRAFVDDDFVLYPGIAEGIAELVDLVGSDALVGAAHEREDGALHLTGTGGGTGSPIAARAGAAVEADGAGESVAVRGLQP